MHYCALTALFLAVAFLPSPIFAEDPSDPPASPGATNDYTITDSTDILTVHWAYKKIDTVNLAGKTAADFASFVYSHSPEYQYDSHSSSWTDYCTLKKHDRPGCVHLHIVPTKPNTDLNEDLLLYVIQEIRHMVWRDIWTLEAWFTFGPKDGAPLGQGFVTQREPSGAETVFGSTTPEYVGPIIPAGINGRKRWSVK